jgi:CRISPR-associated protein Csd2
MSTGVNCGQVRGPVQLAFAKSQDSIVPREITVTRMAVTTEKEAEAQKGDNRTMGSKFIIPYALYRVHGFVSAPLAETTGFSDADLDLFWQALQNMFEHDRSASRGEMTARKLCIFKHADKLGNAPAHALFDRISIARAEDISAPPRKFGDYMVTADKQNLPGGVELIEKL